MATNNNFIQTEVQNVLNDFIIPRLKLSENTAVVLGYYPKDSILSNYCSIRELRSFGNETWDKNPYSMELAEEASSASAQFGVNSKVICCDDGQIEYTFWLKR